jgi:hypothetical protein
MTARARVGAVAVLLAAGAAFGQATARTAPQPPAPQQVSVVAGTAVCPDVRQEGDRGATAVTAAGASGRTAGGLRGRAVQLPDGPVAADLAATAGPVVVTAEGEGSGSLVVEQTTRATGGSRRGLAALACPGPTTSAWFVGGGTVVGSYAELLLVNAGDVPALVDVSVWTADGPADPRPGRGISVPARTRAALPLDRLAPDRDLLALHVQATRGQVAPALRVVRSDGRVPLGTDWVPAGLPPARQLLVPGLPDGPGRRTALLANPGPDDATAQLELLTEDGQVPLEPVAVPAGTSIAVDLSEPLADTAAALRVRADVPLLAGASAVDRQDGPVREISFTASTDAVRRTTRLADVRLSAPTEVTLLLTATGQDAVVDLVPVGAPGELPERQQVTVPAATTVAVRLSRFLPPGSAGSLSIEVRLVQGQVHAARYARERGTRGPLTTLLPLRPQRDTVPRPRVVADPGAGR